MAIIGKIRQKSGLLIVIIGIALAAFVLGDLFKSGGSSRKIVSLAIIDGEKISYNEFSQEVENQAELRKQQTGNEQLSADEIFQIKQFAYNQMVRDIVLGKEYAKLGLAISHDKDRGASISKEEFDDLVFGNNPHQVIMQNFRDPETGQFNPVFVSRFYEQVKKQMNDGSNQEQQELAYKQYAQLMQIEDYIWSDRLNTKYNNLIKKAYYVPKAIAEKAYIDQNRVANFRFFSQRYTTIPDTAVTITDADYKKYYDEHKIEFERDEETRSFDYLVFDINPSTSDIAALQKLIADYRVELENTELKEVPDVINRIPDNQYDSSWFKQGTLSLSVDSALFNSPVGSIFGPYTENNSYNLAILMDLSSRPDSMKASHILIAYTGALRAEQDVTRSKQEAESLADSILLVLKKNPAQFEDLAVNISNDPTAKEKSGDLGWFADGVMVPEFNDFCLKSKVGDMDKVETPYGIHIIKVTGKLNPMRKARVGFIKVLIEPSEETIDYVWKNASEFISSNRTSEEFDASIEKKGLNKRTAEKVRAMDNNIAGLQSPRELLMWAFDKETKKGDVASKIFEFENKYVIAVLKEIQTKGIPTVEDVKRDIEVLVRRDKKAEVISEKINNNLANFKEINALAAKLNTKVDTVDFLTFSSYTVPGYGPEPFLIGSIFAAPKNVLSKPIKGEQGVFVFHVDNFTEPKPAENYDNVRSQIKNNFVSRIQNEIYQALEKSVKIEDNRILFY